MRSYNEPVINAADASVSQNSIIVDVQNLHMMSVIVSMSGTAAGTVKVQASNDEPLNNVPPNNFVDIAGATVAVSAGGQFIIPKFDICYKFVKVVYTFASGTGTISARLHAIGY